MSFVDILRDALFGNPPSPTTKPSREGVLAAFTGLSGEVSLLVSAAVAAGAIVYQTRASLYADLAHPANALAIVVADSDPAKNGAYVKVGASGSGAWALTGILLTGATGAQGAAGDAGDVANIEAARVAALGDIEAAGAAAVGDVTDIVADIAAALPYNNNRLGAPVYQSFPTGSTLSADRETMLLPAGVGKEIDVYFTAEQLAETGPIRMFLQIRSGSAASAFPTKIGRWNGATTQIGGDVALTVKSDGLEYVGTRPTGATNFRFVVAAPADTYVYRAASGVKPLVNPVTDPYYLALSGAAKVASDVTVPLFNFKAPTTYLNDSLPIVSGFNSYDFVPLISGEASSAILDGERLWLTYDINFEPTVVQFYAQARHDSNGGTGGGSTFSKPIRLFGNTWMQYLDIQSTTPGTNTFFGVRFNSNTATPSLTLRNVRIFRGINPPVASRTDNVTAGAIAQANKQARRDLVSKPMLTAHTDSTMINTGWPLPGQMLAKLAGDSFTVRVLSVPGGTLTQIMTVGGLLKIPLSAGITIPADLTPVAITYPTGYDPITLNSLGNTDCENAFELNGIVGKLVVGSYSGFNPVPGTVSFQRLVADSRGFSTDIAAGTPLIPRHYLETRGGKRIIYLNTVNGFGSYPGTQQQLIEEVTTGLNTSDIILLANLAPSPYALPTKPAWLTGHRLENCYVDWNATDATTRTRAQASPVSWTPAGGDLAAMAAGTVGIPASARAGDAYHTFPISGSFMSIQNIIRSAPYQAWLR